MLFPWIKARRQVKHYEQYSKSQWYSSAQLKALQEEKLLALLTHAAKNTPYYNKILNLGKLTNSSALEYLPSLPILDKPLLQAEFLNLISDSSAGFTGHIHSSGGTTGQPVKYYLDDNLKVIGKAIERRGDFEWTHTHPQCRKAILWGRVDTKKRRLSLLRGFLNKQWKYYAYKASENDLAAIAKSLATVRPELIMGYSSMLGIIAEYLLQKGIKDIRPKTILATAEMLTEETRLLAMQAFGCPVYNRYASSEFGLIASECEKGNLHIHTERFVLEVLKDGKPVPPGEEGEIFITDLDNYAFPFLRYATGDIGAVSPIPCSCGRGLPVLKKLSGRTADYIKTPSGIAVLAVETFTAFRTVCSNHEIKRVQIVQRALDTIIARLVIGDGYSAQMEERMRSMLFELCFNNTGIKQIGFEYVKALDVAPSGKIPFYISMLEGE
ncbi:MAG: phenylacetate--CoA ligase family protein [Acidaminococcaceae bacterium]